MEPVEKPSEISQIIFREEQRFRNPLLWYPLLGTSLLVTGVMAFAIWEQVVNQQTFGTNPIPNEALILVGGIAILLNIGLLVLFFALTFIVQVHTDGLYLQFIPLHFHPVDIPLEEVRSVGAVVYNPIKDYGGWGIRYSRKGKAYNVSGNRGVRLEWQDGKQLLIGSQRADELAAAITRARNYCVAMESEF